MKSFSSSSLSPILPIVFSLFFHFEVNAQDVRTEAISRNDLIERNLRNQGLLNRLPPGHPSSPKIQWKVDVDRSLERQLEALNAQTFEIAEFSTSDNSVKQSLSADQGPEPPYRLEDADFGVPMAAIYGKPIPGSDSILLAAAGQRLVVRSVFEGGVEDHLLATSNDGFIYGFCFPSNFPNDSSIYVFYNYRDETPNLNRIIRHELVFMEGKWRLGEGTRKLLEWVSIGHNGGDLLFGKDGYLYIATGDGSSDMDQYLSAQDFSDLRGAVLRIDVSESSDENPYTIPEANPFSNIDGVRGEIYAKGLRNPWRMSMDSETGEIYIGNSGQDTTESVYRLEKGANYGWSRWEGGKVFQEKRPLGIGKLTFPIIDHSHNEARALTGGFVYRGTKYPDLNGMYIYGDYETGKIWGARIERGQPIQVKELANTYKNPVCFFQSASEDVIILGQTIFRLEPNAITNQSTSMDFPKLLSETKLYKSTESHIVADGVRAYKVVAPAWNNSAESDRFFWIPDGTNIRVTSNGTLNFPTHSVLFQTLWLPVPNDLSGARVRIETRVFVKRPKDWSAFSYLWNDAQTDALLVPAKGKTIDLVDHFGEEFLGFGALWSVPSRMSCYACHTFHQNRLLGFQSSQLQVDSSFGNALNQLEQWNADGILMTFGKSLRQSDPVLVNPYGTESSLEHRVRSYLHVNCGSCHTSVGGGNSKLNLQISTPLNKTEMINALPEHSDFGLRDGRIVFPSQYQKSILINRLSSTDLGRMPPVGRSMVDHAAVLLLRDWIGSMPPPSDLVRNWQFEELLEKIEGPQGLLKNSDVKNGQRVYNEAGCSRCHRVANQGAGLGPDLSDIAVKRSLSDILKSIVNPSDQIPENYQSIVFHLADGETLEGSVIEESDQILSIVPKNRDGRVIKLSRSQIESVVRSKVSSMPSGLLDGWSASDVSDLLHFLISQGTTDP